MMKVELLNSLFSDLASGVAVGAIAFPLAIAFAIASGLDPGCGLVTAIAAGLIIAWLGGSRVLVGGPLAAFTVIAYGIVQKYGYSGLAMAIAMAGIVILLLGAFKLGCIMKFIPYPVIAGYTSGIAVCIVIAAIGDFCGFAGTRMPGDFVGNIAAYASPSVIINPWAVGTSIVTILIILALRKIGRRMPGPLIAIVAVTVAAWLINFPVDTIGSRYGAIQAAFPAPVLPSISLSLARELFFPALAIAFVASAESLLGAVVADGVIGRRHDSNGVLVALGLANVASAVLGGIPASGSIARTVSNVQNGGRTPIAALSHSLVLLALFVFLGRFVPYVPMAAIAATLVSVAWDMVGFSAVTAIVRGRKSGALILTATFVLTVFVDLTVAIAIGLLFSALFRIGRTATDPFIKEIKYEMSLSDGVKEGDARDANRISIREIPRNVLVYEIEGPLVFGAIELFARTFLPATPGCRVLILRMRRTIFIDEGGLRKIEGLVSDCQRRGIALFVSDIHTQPFMLAVKSGLDEKIGRERIFGNLDEALAASAKLIGVARSGDQATAKVRSQESSASPMRRE